MAPQTATKSRAEKAASRGGGGAQSVPVPVVTNDVVPGRLSFNEWTKMMQEEDDTNFVCSIVEDIVDNALEGCYKKYIWNQVLPFTVHQAKDALLQIVQWHFLNRDSGEVDIANDPGWKEDSEPEAGIIDSWAQGSVPVVVRRQSSSAPSTSAISEEHTFLQGPLDDAHIVAESLVSGTEPTTLSDEHTEVSGVTTENTLIKGTAASPLDAVKTPSEEAGLESVKVVQKKRRSYKKHTGRLPPLRSIDFEEIPKVETNQVKAAEKDANLSPSQKSLLKVQAGRPPGNREVTFDDRGNVVGVMKLKADTLPLHRVRVQYRIIDPQAEANAQNLNAMRTGRYRPTKKFGVESSLTKSSTIPSHILSATTSKEGSATTRSNIKKDYANYFRSRTSKNKGTFGARIDPLPPSMIDAIDASPGVIIREGGNMKQGPEEKFSAGISRTPFEQKQSITNIQPLFRTLGRNSPGTTLQPPIDPIEVVQTIKKSNSVSRFALKNPLPQLGSRKTAEA